MTIYADGSTLSATLDPIRAVALAQELIAAAPPKLRAAPAAGAATGSGRP